MVGTQQELEVESTHKGRRNAVFVAAGALTATIGVAFINPATGVISCPFKMVTGLDCPLCGGTRATHAALNGDFVAALGYNALIFLLLPLAAYFTVASIVSLWRGEEVRVPSASWVIIAFFAVFTVVRNLPFSWAEPLRS